MVKAIILAGGRSSCMPGETLKQYRKVNNDKMLGKRKITQYIEKTAICDLSGLQFLLLKYLL